MNEKGDARAEYDFAALPLSERFQRELAEAFAARTTPTGVWRNLPSSKQGFWCLQFFARWLSKNSHAPESIAALSKTMWLEFRLANINDSSATLRALRVTRMILLETGLLSAETRMEVVRRIPKEAAHEASYSDEELRQVRVAARRVFRAARERIRANLEHLRQHRDGAFVIGTSDHIIGEALESIASTGDVPRQWFKRDRSIKSTYKRALGGGDPENRWKRLYLDDAELSAALILIACKEGWNETTISELTVPTRVDGTRASADQTVYRLELEKRRRRAPHRYETRTLTDTGADSTARLLTQVIEVTQPARDLLATHGIPTDRLLLSRRTHVSQSSDLPKSVDRMFRAGPGDHSRDAFRRASGVGVNLRRVRKAVNTRYRREANQNTPATHDSVYAATDPHFIELSEKVIARGVERAVTHAAEVELVVAAEDSVLGEDTATAACVDAKRSPFSPWGVACNASFLLCLACHNAVVMPKHLGRLAYLHDALSNLRQSLAPEVWRRDWADHYDRLHGLRTQHYSEAQWQQAMSSLAASDRAIVDHLLKGDLDT